ncbi:hypothetical protein HMI48_05070 [Acidithiobacillus ferrooxidans]|uniref:metallophosphoesterase n=1 Tax=Acidithiobacillus ferrooxidans TaxID=920 RepID=UPI001C0796F7|nr:hypothetical protein [Acidithiobacillus ferrooxidans]
MSSFLQDNPLAIHHASNPEGRDFVVGDLHGCRAMLDTLLAHARFDLAKDRLFSVGDLVDRGPDSIGCLELLRESWFFPVLRNHDAMLLAFWSEPCAGDVRQIVYRRAFGFNRAIEWASCAGRLGLAVVGRWPDSGLPETDRGITSTLAAPRVQRFCRPGEGHERQAKAVGNSGGLSGVGEQLDGIP